MNLFQILGTIAVNNSDANSSIDETATKAESMASTLGDKFTTAGNTISGIGKKLAPVSAGVTAVGTALVGLATKTASTTDNIDKMSQKLGISRTAYQEWDYILSQNGASIDSLKTGMKTLTTTLDGVNTAGSTAGTAFERLGISYDDLAGKDSEEVFALTVEALQNCQDETERTTLATTLFGKAGVELAPLLNSGAEATEALKQKAHDLGLILDDETIDAGVNMTDAMDTMKRSLSAAGSAIATAVMPYVTQFCNFISAHMPQVQAAIKSVVQKFNELSPTVKKVIAVVAALLAAASPVLIVVGKFVSGVGGIITQVGSAITKIGSLVGSFGKLGGALGAVTSPIGIVVAAIAALIAIFVVLYNTNEDFRNTVDTAWAAIKETISGVIEAVKALIQAFVSLIQKIWAAWGQDIVNVVTTVFNAVATFVQNALNVIKAIIQTVTALIKGDWSGVWEGIKNIVSATWETIKGLVQGALNILKSVIQLGLNVIKTVFTTVWNAIKSLITTVWNSIKSTITTVLNAIKTFITTVFNAIKSTVTTVWNGIKTTITTVINGVKSTISSGLNGAYSTVTSVLNNIKNKFSSIMNSAASVVSGAINKIKGFFNFSWSLPSIKLPHFSISGSFSLNPPSIPHFSVSWYKKAMDEPYMFTKPTIFDVNPTTGQARGAGEAGDELMIGKETLLNMIRQAVAEQNAALIDRFDLLIELLSEFFPQVLEMMNRPVVLDDGTLVGKLAPAMDEALGEILRRKERG